jgi:retron-type reverse transcriptase
MQYSEVYDFMNLYNAYLKARKQKRYRSEVLQFSFNLDTELIMLQDELQHKRYKVGLYRQHIIYEPKRRQIVALPFRDRVVQHALNTIVEPIFDKRMIDDSFACRQGKGTHAAVKRLSYFMGKPDTIYYLKLDVQSFFASIHIATLKAVIRRTIADSCIIWLIDTILDSSPVPGMPIGNLMSQLFANVYLHELDHYCKNVLSVKYYIRYMDDILILSSNKAYLRAVLADIEYFVTTNLMLTLNRKTCIGKCKDGIEFVGYRVWRNLRLIKKQSLTRMKKKVRAWKSGKVNDDKFMASIGSWMGHSVDTSSYRGVMRIALDSMREMARRAAVNGR